MTRKHAHAHPRAFILSLEHTNEGCKPAGARRATISALSGGCSRQRCRRFELTIAERYDRRRRHRSCSQLLVFSVDARAEQRRLLTRARACSHQVAIASLVRIDDDRARRLLRRRRRRRARHKQKNPLRCEKVGDNRSLRARSNYNIKKLQKQAPPPLAATRRCFAP